MSTDRNKSSSSDGCPYNHISGKDAQDLSAILKPQGCGCLVIGKVSDSTAACSQADGDAFVNESTKAITNLPVYYCCGFEKEGDVSDVTASTTRRTRAGTWSADLGPSYQRQRWPCPRWGAGGGCRAPSRRGGTQRPSNVNGLTSSNAVEVRVA